MSPITVGLLYQQGYFRQEIDTNGDQLELYPVNEPGQLPIRPVRTPDGEWLRLRLMLPGGRIWIRTWEVQVGRTRLRCNRLVHNAHRLELDGESMRKERSKATAVARQ